MDIKDTLITALDEAPAVAPKGGWEKHNKQFHNGKMPTPEHCKFLQEHGGGASVSSTPQEESAEQIEDVDTIAEQKPTEGGWSKRLRTMAQAAAKMIGRFMPGVKVRLSETPYEEGGADERKSISGVFTGSQADYDQPSLQYVGTGVGAQNQGYGLYGVGSPDSARFFLNIDRDMSRLLKVNGETLDPDKERIFDETSHGKYIALQNVLKTGDREEALSKLRNGEVGSLDRPEVQKAIEFLENTPDIRVAWKEGVQRNDYNNPEWQVGNLYEQTFFTDRKGKWQDYLLDYDNNVSRRQWEKIKSALVSQHPDFGQELVDEIDEDTSGRPTGAEIYEAISYYLDSEGTAKFLTSIGIDGVRYQANQQGTPGYVSFRDDNIRVDHKWTNGEMRYFKGDGGKVVGTYNRRTGEVVLYPGADKNTIAHELGGHATWQYAEQLAKEGDDRLLRKMNAVVDNAPRPIKKEVAKNYGKETGAVRREEVWAHVMGNRGSAAIQKALESKRGRTWWGRFWNTAKEAWRGLASKVGLNRVDLSNIDAMSPDEFANYMAREMASGKVLGSIKYDKTSPASSDDGGDKRKSFIGWLGAYNLGGLAKLSEADRMAQKGASREDIWRKTGWYQGKDGKWRIELLDTTKKAPKSPVIRVLRNPRTGETEYGATLGSLVKNDKLFTAYPELAEVPVFLRKDMEGDNMAVTTLLRHKGMPKGFYTPIFITMKGDPDRLRFDLNDKQLGSLTHELQHAVQGLEGFENGTTFSVDKDYHRVVGEVEARNARRREQMTREERLAKPPWETEDVPEAEQKLIDHPQKQEAASARK